MTLCSILVLLIENFTHKQSAFLTKAEKSLNTRSYCRQWEPCVFVSNLYAWFMVSNEKSRHLYHPDAGGQQTAGLGSTSGLHGRSVDHFTAMCLKHSSGEPWSLPGFGPLLSSHQMSS